MVVDKVVEAFTFAQASLEDLNHDMSGFKSFEEDTEMEEELNDLLTLKKFQEEIRKEFLAIRGPRPF